MSSSSTSSAPPPSHTINQRLEAEDSAVSRSIMLQSNNELASGYFVSAQQIGSYLEWHIEVPEDKKYRLNVHHASISTGNLQVFIDSKLIAEIATNTGYSAVWSTSVSTEFPLTSGVHTLRINFDSTLPNLDWIEFLPSYGPDAQDELATGLWRVASRKHRLSLSYMDAQNTLSLGTYSGNIRQHWRINLMFDQKMEVRHEESGKCLQQENKILKLGTCGVSTSLWILEKLREKSEDRPAVYYVKPDTENCLNLSKTTPFISACSLDTRIYIEATGYGERSYPREYEVNALLIIKKVTKHPQSDATISDAAIAAVKTSFEEHVAVWFDRMTDGRVRWVGNIVVSPDPLTSFSIEGGNYLPAPMDVQTDVERYIEIGQYDVAGAFFHSGQLPGGWGWGPGRSEASKQTLWITVNGGGTAAHDWISWEHEPLEVFIHEPMHGYDSHFYPLGLPLPDGFLHGTELNEYSRESNGYIHWYRDYWLGTVIAADDTYRGYGSRMFRMPTPRESAFTPQSAPLSIWPSRINPDIFYSEYINNPK